MASDHLNKITALPADSPVYVLELSPDVEMSGDQIDRWTKQLEDRVKAKLIVLPHGCKMKAASLYSVRERVGEVEREFTFATLHEMKEYLAEQDKLIPPSPAEECAVTPSEVRAPRGRVPYSNGVGSGWIIGSGGGGGCSPDSVTITTNEGAGATSAGTVGGVPDTVICVAGGGGFVSVPAPSKRKKAFHNLPAGSRGRVFGSLEEILTLEECAAICERLQNFGKPNQVISTAELMRRIDYDLVTYGRAYVWLLRNQHNQVSELHWLNPACMQCQYPNGPHNMLWKVNDALIPVRDVAEIWPKQKDEDKAAPANKEVLSVTKSDGTKINVVASHCYGWKIVEVGLDILRCDGWFLTNVRFGENDEFAAIETASHRSFLAKCYVVHKGDGEMPDRVHFRSTGAPFSADMSNVDVAAIQKKFAEKYKGPEHPAIKMMVANSNKPDQDGDILDPAGVQMPATLYGLPIVFTEKIPAMVTGDIVLEWPPSITEEGPALKRKVVEGEMRVTLEDIIEAKKALGLPWKEFQAHYQGEPAAMQNAVCGEPDELTVGKIPKTLDELKAVVAAKKAARAAKPPE